eukprot:1023260-Prymnesium_polylepis.2
MVLPLRTASSSKCRGSRTLLKCRPSSAAAAFGSALWPCPWPSAPWGRALPLRAPCGPAGGWALGRLPEATFGEASSNTSCKYHPFTCVCTPSPHRAGPRPRHTSDLPSSCIQQTLAITSPGSAALAAAPSSRGAADISHPVSTARARRICRISLD